VSRKRRQTPGRGGDPALART